MRALVLILVTFALSAFADDSRRGNANYFDPERLTVNRILPILPTTGTCDPLAMANNNGVSITLTRTTVAGCFDAAGVYHQMAAGQARVESNGILMEPAATNFLLNNRDLSLWTTLTNATSVLSINGIDGANNTASSITATANNGIITQTLSFGSAVQRVFSIYLKRKTGTGTVWLTVDNGVGLTDVTSQINGAGFTRITLTGSNSTGPIVGIKLATSGDVIYADMAQFEVGTVPTSPLQTAGTAVTRNGDLLVVSTPYNTPADPFCFSGMVYLDNNADTIPMQGLGISGNANSATAFLKSDGTAELKFIDNSSNPKTLDTSSGVSSGGVLQNVRICSDNLAGGVNNVYVNGTSQVLTPGGAGNTTITIPATMNIKAPTSADIFHIMNLCWGSGPGSCL